jgi:hypothetical protein
MRTRCLLNTNRPTDCYRDTKLIIRVFLNALMIPRLRSLFVLKSLNPIGLRDHEKVGTVACLNAEAK